MPLLSAGHPAETDIFSAGSEFRPRRKVFLLAAARAIGTDACHWRYIPSDPHLPNPNIS